MKKIIIFALVATMGFASNGLAAAITNAAAVTIGSIEYKPSTGVTVIANSTASAYSVGSKHLNGDLAFGSDNTSADMWEVTATKGQAIESVPTKPGGAGGGGGGGGGQ